VGSERAAKVESRLGMAERVICINCYINNLLCQEERFGIVEDFAG
jgi:hypothetical protein